MSIQYGNHFVDERYSPLFEPALFSNNPFKPGVSFTDKYQEKGGQIYAHKLGKGTVTPSTPGGDFTDADVADSLILISKDTAFRRSRKIYGAIEATVEGNIAAGELDMAINEVAEAWALKAMKSLLNGETSITAPVETTATLGDGSDIYNDIVANRQKLVENFANPTTIIVSPKTYSKLLKSPEFQRSTNISDNAIANGIVGRIAGMDVIEYNNFDNSYTSGDVVAGVTLDANDEIEYVMYDKDAYSIVTALEMIRTKDSERFNGVLAQVETIAGYKVTNDERVLAKVVQNV